MFEVLLSNYRLPRANYKNVTANALVFDAKLFHLNLLQGNMVVQDEKSVHFRIMAGSYLSHDAKSIGLKNVSGTYVSSDPQYNRHAAVTLSYLTEDQQSFSLFSVNALCAENDGNGGLYVARNRSDYVVDDPMMRIGLGATKAHRVFQQHGRVAPNIVGQIAVPAIEDYPMGFASINGHCCSLGNTAEFGIVTSLGMFAAQIPALFTMSTTIVGQTCDKLLPTDSMSANAVIGLVVVKDKTSTEQSVLGES